MFTFTLNYNYLTIIFNCFFLDCSDYDVRLVNGPDPYEGTVEVCNYHSWGQVLDQDWGNTEAQVICNQLGYNNTGIEL